MKYLITLLVISTCLVSCIQDRLPNGFPDEEEFAEILADVHLSEATISQLRLNNKDIDSKASAYYQGVLEKHNLTEELFDTITSWYLSHPQIYQEVYESVLSKLGHKEAEWQQIVKDQKAKEESIRKEKERRNIWKLDKKFSINDKDTIDRRIPFEFDVDTIEADSYRLSAFYQFLKGNLADSVKLELIAMYKDSSFDTLQYHLPSTYNNTKAELFVGKDGNDTIVKLSGYLLNHDTTELIKARVKQIELEFIPPVDSLLLNEENSISLLP
ncbi:DUF4296 domain-containing protein [Saccharicrinis aurantiacus]|uniref:DUF4296 domain-containing protein n=1 Tax=Saccharicrinis aurantiacus TaxID=1849719 RepID=UPI00094F9173|nr:DUF4296 domain-containing protein [Saccharicrinis aurantiacus]